MKIVTLPFREGNSEQESHRGVMISRWLKEQGLQMGRDYTWKIDHIKREIEFMFNGDAEAWATMLTMKEL
jgi:fatty acid desaturase